MKKVISFKNKEGLTLRGFVYNPFFGSGDTAILFLHGFPGHCSSSAQRFCRALSFSCRTMGFDFSGTDTSEGKFENKLISKEVSDIKYAIDFLETNYGFKRLFLVGISTGAIDAALYSYKDKRITGVVLLAGVSNLKKSVHYDFSAQQITCFKKKKYIVYNHDGKWYNGKKLKKKFYDEFFTLNISHALKKCKKPLLIIHGEKDIAVPVKEAYDLYAIANQPKKLVIIKNADHKFSKVIHWLQAISSIRKFIKIRY